MEKMMKKKALIIANVASMIDQFNRENIRILMEMGCEVTVCCNFVKGSTCSMEKVEQLKRDLDEMGVRWYHAPITRSIYDIRGIWKSYWVIRGDIAKERYDLMHCQSPIGGVIARLACFNYRKITTIIYYSHGFHFFSGAPLFNWLIFYPIEKLVSRFTEYILVLNKDDFKVAKKKFHAKHIMYMPGVGVDIAGIQEKSVNRDFLQDVLGIPKDKKMILYVGELSKRKNVLVTIQAFAEARYPNTVLVMCGMGALENEIRMEIDRLGLQDKVFLLGYRQDIIEIMKVADLFFFPTKQEGLPVALMQAMAAGLPVVCSDIRGNRDLIDDGKGGYLYEPMDVNGFARGLREILSDTKMATQMSNVNLEKIKQFSKEHVNAKMKAFYESII